METEPNPLSCFILLWNGPLVDLGPTTWLGLGAIAILLIFSALMSGSEVAYFSITHNDISKLQSKEGAAKNKILKLLERPHYLLSTILIGNNFVNIGIILVSNFVLNRLVPEGSLHEYLIFFIKVILVTFLLVLFGEVAPKVYANTFNMRIARLMSTPLYFLRSIFYPLSWVLVNSTQIIERSLHKRMNNGNHNVVSRRDIEQAIELTVGDTQYAAEDIGLLKSIIKFGNISVKNIMRSRVDVTAIDSECSFTEVVDMFKEFAYSRVPVYEETFDKVIGILHSKDLLEHFDKKDEFDWHTLIRTAFFVPENKKIDDLFGDFQIRRTHMAIVVDEYGGTSGIVTLEDVLEEIVGEINDEFDEPDDKAYTKVNDYVYIFDGKTTLTDVCKILNIDYHTFDEGRGSAESIAGLLLVLNGSIPKKNAETFYKSYKLTVVSSSERRIESVKITLPIPESSGNGG